jgi:hypothetical protein
MELSMNMLRASTMVVVLSIIMASGALAAEKFQRLSGSQINARLAGMEITDEVHSADVFERGGVLISYSMSRRTTGKWRVQNDMLCLDRGKDGSACYEVWLAGKKVELKHPGSDLSLEGVLQKPMRRK